MAERESYDERCEELARFFLQSVPHATPRDIRMLAQRIQWEIEAYLEKLEEPKAEKGG